MTIKLRKYKKSDLKRHLEIFLMNGIYKKINPKIEKQEKEWLDKAIENYKKEKPGFYVLAITLDGKLIGNCIAEKIDYKGKTAEIGFWIGKDYWNKGYTTKALGLFFKRIKDKLDLKKVHAKHERGNPASGRVLEKDGFTFEEEKGKLIAYSKTLK